MQRSNTQCSNTQQSIAAVVVVMGYAAMQCDEQLMCVLDNRRCVSGMRGNVVTPAFAGNSHSMF